MAEVAERKALMGIRVFLDPKKAPRNLEQEINEDFMVRTHIEGDEMEVKLSARIERDISFQDKERMKLLFVQEAKKLVDKYGKDE